MMLMAVPLMVLYEIGIIGARLFGRGRPGDVDLPMDPDLTIRTAGHRVR
jgi:sec-independent protein translocase protein TatC